ncbi:TPA: glycosyltransferase family 2 protein [Campylobacter jejuni]
MPKISILCPSFNHERYVGYFIESVLNQTFKDFELIIVDDCSSDENVKKIQAFKDERIKFIQHAYNKGINAALNTAFENSSGEILLFCASDDILESNALEKINEAFEKNSCDVLYVGNTRIDENNQILKKKACPILDKNEKQLVYNLFMVGNYPISMGMSTRREIFNKIYPLHNAFCNQQDTLMHIALLLNGAKVLALDEYIVCYRVASNHTSISANINVNVARANLEMEILMQEFLKIDDIDFLENIFAKEIQITGIRPYKETLKFFLGYMALQSEDKAKKYWGYHKIMEFYSDNVNAELLKEKYNFTFKDYVKLSALCLGGRYEKKFKKYKKRFIKSIALNIFLVGIIIAMLLFLR